MPNVRASSGTIGTMRLPSLLVAQQLAQHAHEGHRRRRLAPAGALEELLEVVAGMVSGSAWDHLRARHGRRALRGARAGTDLRAVLRAGGRTAPRSTSSSEMGMSKRSRNCAQLVLVELLLLVRDVRPSPASPMP
jgi:hypothetical protein